MVVHLKYLCMLVVISTYLLVNVHVFDTRYTWYMTVPWHIYFDIFATSYNAHTLTQTWWCLRENCFVFVRYFPQRVETCANSIIYTRERVKLLCNKAIRRYCIALSLSLSPSSSLPPTHASCFVPRWQPMTSTHIDIRRHSTNTGIMLMYIMHVGVQMTIITGLCETSNTTHSNRQNIKLVLIT